MLKVILFTVLAIALMWGLGKLRYTKRFNEPHRQLSEEFFQGAATVVDTFYTFACIKSNLADLEIYLRKLVGNGEIAVIGFVLVVTFILIGFGWLLYKLSVVSGNIKAVRIARTAHAAHLAR